MGYADEDAGIAVVVAHLEYDANRAIAELAAGPVEQTHAALTRDQPVFQRCDFRDRRASSLSGPCH